jgi:hypothetical protein
MGLFGWFKRVRRNRITHGTRRQSTLTRVYLQDESDFEKVLEELDGAIQQREQELADIRYHESRALSIVTLYSLAAWVVYLGVWWLTTATTSFDTTIWFLSLTPVAAGPVMCVTLL